MVCYFVSTGSAIAVLHESFPEHRAVPFMCERVFCFTSTGAFCFFHILMNLKERIQAVFGCPCIYCKTLFVIIYRNFIILGHGNFIRSMVSNGIPALFQFGIPESTTVVKVCIYFHIIGKDSLCSVRSYNFKIKRVKILDHFHGSFFRNFLVRI